MLKEQLMNQIDSAIVAECSVWYHYSIPKLSSDSSSWVQWRLDTCPVRYFHEQIDVFQKPKGL